MDTGGLFQMRKGRKSKPQSMMNHKIESAIPNMKVKKVRSHKHSFLP